MCNRCVFTIYILFIWNRYARFYICKRDVQSLYRRGDSPILEENDITAIIFFLFIFLKFELFNSTSYIFEFIKLSIYNAVRLISLLLGIKILAISQQNLRVYFIGICFQMLFKVYIKEDDNHYFPIEERVHGAVNMKI